MKSELKPYEQDKTLYVPMFFDWINPEGKDELLLPFSRSALHWGTKIIVEAFEPFTPLFLTHHDLQSLFTQARFKLGCMPYTDYFHSCVYEFSHDQRTSFEMQTHMKGCAELIDALKLALYYAEVHESPQEWLEQYAKFRALGESAIRNWLFAMRWVLNHGPHEPTIDELEDIFGHP